MAELSLFRAVLGREFDRLAPVLQRHYDLLPGQEMVIQGHMKAWSRYPLLRALIPIMPLNADDVPVRVRNSGVRNERGQVCFKWEREFNFPGHMLRSETLTQAIPPASSEPSVMDVFTQPPAVVTLQLSVEEEGRALKQIAAGPQYALIGSARLPLPGLLHLNTLAIERAIDDTHIFTEVRISHRLLGPMFGYSGRLRVES